MIVNTVVKRGENDYELCRFVFRKVFTKLLKIDYKNKSEKKNNLVEFYEQMKVD